MKTCEWCYTELNKDDEVVVMHGVLFCSEECAEDFLVEGIIRGARETAREELDEYAEIVKAEDIL